MLTRHRMLHWAFAVLSWLPDPRRVAFCFDWIARVRGTVLGWQPNKHIEGGVRIWNRCRFTMDAIIRIEEDCLVKERVSVGGTLSLGRGSVILAHTRIDASGGVQIGAGTHIGRHNVIFTHKHDILRRDVPVLSAPEVHEPVKIGDDVMLFSRVAVMPGVTIGDGAVVGFRSVVTKDLEPYGIYAGIPARKLGTRE